MRIPAGKHEIEFRFEPASYAKGKTISTISSATLILGVLGIVGTGLWGFLKNPPVEEAPKPKPAAPAPTPKPQQPQPTPVASRKPTGDRRDPKRRKR
jgi:hypothetical protein